MNFWPSCGSRTRVLLRSPLTNHRYMSPPDLFHIFAQRAIQKVKAALSSLVSTIKTSFFFFDNSQTGLTRPRSSVSTTITSYVSEDSVSRWSLSCKVSQRCINLVKLTTITFKTFALVSNHHRYVGGTDGLCICVVWTEKNCFKRLWNVSVTISLQLHWITVMWYCTNKNIPHVDGLRSNNPPGVVRFRWSATAGTTRWTKQPLEPRPVVSSPWNQLFGCQSVWLQLILGPSISWCQLTRQRWFQFHVQTNMCTNIPPSSCVGHKQVKVKYKSSGKHDPLFLSEKKFPTNVVCMNMRMKEGGYVLDNLKWYIAVNIEVI